MPHLLIIDDDDLVRDALALIMEAYGYEVSVAASTREAIDEVAGGTRPDAILADYRLRGEDTGVRAVQAVRELVGDVIPALILTGDTAPERLREIHGYGLTVLHKPVLGATLMAGLSTALAGFHAQARRPRCNFGDEMRA